MLAPGVQLDMINSLGERKGLDMHTHKYIRARVLEGISGVLVFRRGGLQLAASWRDRRID